MVADVPGDRLREPSEPRRRRSSHPGAHNLPERYRRIEAAGVEVLEDDRDGKPGVKFKDMDLIGIPYRLVISKRTLEAGEVEFKKRGSADAQRWKVEEAADRLKALLT